MLPKNIRLNKQQAQNTKLNGIKYFSPHLKLTIFKDKTIQHTNWQIKVFKKTYPLSTDRNRVKRKIRAAIKNISLSINTRANIVIQLTKSADKISVSQLQQEITLVLQKTKTL